MAAVTRVLLVICLHAIITRTEAEEVDDGVLECQFYIKGVEERKFRSLEQLYKYHGKHPLTFTDKAGTKYEACLGTPVHSSVRAVKHSVSEPRESRAPPGQPCKDGNVGEGEGGGAAPPPDPQTLRLSRELELALDSPERLAIGRTATIFPKAVSDSHTRTGHITVGTASAKAVALANESMPSLVELASPLTGSVDKSYSGPDSVASYVENGFAVPFEAESTPYATHTSSSGIQTGALPTGGTRGRDGDRSTPSSRGRGRGGRRKGRGRGGGGGGAASRTVPAEGDGSGSDSEFGGFEASGITFGIDHPGDEQETTTDAIDIGNFAGSSTTGGEDDAAGSGTTDLDLDDDSSSAKGIYQSRAALYVAPGQDDGNQVYASVLQKRTYNVTCVGSAQIQVLPEEQLMLTVVNEQGTERVLVTSTARKEVKSFVAKLLHSLKFKGNSMSFENIERGGARSEYKFEFEDSTAASDFGQDLPAEVQYRYADSLNTPLITNGGAGASGNAGAGNTVAQNLSQKQLSTALYDAVRKDAAEVTGDASHLRENRSEQLALKTETWAAR